MREKVSLQAKLAQFADVVQHVSLMGKSYQPEAERVSDRYGYLVQHMAEAILVTGALLLLAIAPLLAMLRCATPPEAPCMIRW